MIKENEIRNLQLISAREFFKQANVNIDESENEAFIVLRNEKKPEVEVKILIKKETLDYNFPEFLKANGFKYIRVDKFFYSNDLVIESSALIFGLVFAIETKYKDSDNESVLIIFVPNYKAVASIVERQKSKNILKIKYINCFWNGKELSEEIISEKVYAIEVEDYVKNIEEIKDMLIV
jgi:hypothetical protein